MSSVAGQIYLAYPKDFFMIFHGVLHLSLDSLLKISEISRDIVEYFLLSLNETSYAIYFV